MTINPYRLVVGLGNPGDSYIRTRHNVGFLLLDAFASKHNLKWKSDKKAQALVTNFGKVLLAKPQTYMNRSGISVAYLVNYYAVSPSELLVVHDDIDLELGQTRLQFGAGPAGHHGVEDIMVSLKTKEFWRLRVGVGRPHNVNMTIEDWVLSKFSDDEIAKISAIQLPIGG